jgi:large subunit ribosomal protein L6
VSRIGKQPVPIPAGVTVEMAEGRVRVKGPKGTLFERMPPGIRVQVAEGQVKFERADDKKETRAFHGLARALVANMVKGVTKPFVKELEIQGVGYRADVSGRKINLSLGFSHPVTVEIPEGISVSVDRNVLLRIEGISRARVGQFAADLRALRPPEPYKGKGIRYLGERVRIKVGKAAVTAG